MSKGIKKIKFVPQPNEADNSNSRVSVDKWVIVPANKKAHFYIKEWHKDTTEAQKKGKLYWMVLDRDRKKIIERIECMTDKYFSYKIPKHLCGYPYYVEASMTGKPDVNFTGLFLFAQCPPLIVSSTWSRTRGGKNIKNTDDNNFGFCYGEEIHFHADTEGINGEVVIVEVYNEMWDGDYKMRTLYNVTVTDGQINLKIPNTSEWKSSIKFIQSNEEFYVKIKKKNGAYLKDKNGNVEHGKYLNIKNELKVVNKTKPSNQSTILVGNTDKNHQGVGLCKFKQIIITDDKSVTVFEEGKTKLKRKAQTSYNEIVELVYFDFNKNNIRANDRKTLDVIASKLKNNKHSNVIIEGHADERGPGDFNLRLSQNRSEAVAQYLKQQGLSNTKFLSQGLGENQLIYKGANLTEAQHQENRRAKIRFSVIDHDELSLIYEVIAPPYDSSNKKKINIQVNNFENKGCIGSHEKNIKITDIGQVKNGNEKVESYPVPSKQYEVYSDLSKHNLLPIQYIWPASSTPNKVNVDIHSCTYFANKKIPTVIIRTYPDIKWRFAFYVNLSNSLSIKWQKLSPEKHKELRGKALKLANEEKGKYSEVDFGVELKASFDKQKDGSYGSNPELTGKYSDKISKLFSTISSIKKIAQGITGGTKGNISKGIGRKLPFDIKLNAPAVYVGADWEADVNNTNSEIGTKLKFFLETKPLVELAIVFDLLGLAVQAGVAAATAGTGNALALEIFNMVRDWAQKGYESERVEIKFKMYIDLEVRGKVDGSVDVTYSTVKDGTGIDFALTSNITVELKSGLELKGMYVVIGTTKKPELEGHMEGKLSAGASMGITSGHKLQYDSLRGIYYIPSLSIDPCVGTVVIMVKAGFTYKKVSKDWTPVNYNRTRTFFDGFDIMEKLAKITGSENKLLLWEKKKK
ncbi:OmpA family protein [Chryseobacterium scophthalmum]|uniref:OmpA family protein n=1 Tax=Chryseobacterium scophthalmum TaxID=59733 RepID=A0A1N6J481_9FLAO|nr:OmpA family protein [Chryseobacterium scophthalmum]SIO39033.1 OmpA family protein [Chryseobacterium scophthalmum]